MVALAEGVVWKECVEVGDSRDRDWGARTWVVRWRWRRVSEGRTGRRERVERRAGREVDILSEMPVGW